MSSSSSSSSDKGAKLKKTRKERESEWKVDGSKKIGGVDFTSALVDRQVGDKRYERDRAQKIETQEKGVAALKESQPAVSATFDAFKRMAAGLEGRSIADKINDSNRPTWEQYKKDNEDKLNLVGNEVKKMAEYRVELDKERDRKLSMGSNNGKKSTAIDSDSEEEEEEDEKKSKKSKDKKDKKKRKSSSKDSKEKKHHKKEKKKRRREEEEKEEESDGSSDDDSDKASDRTPSVRDSNSNNNLESLVDNDNRLQQIVEE